jgi:DNA-binding transcriptional MerR regulator
MWAGGCDMEKHRAIPKGYMTVGEVAKKMNTTVRTLQYYDKEGVLSASSESEGGRRLYTDRDIIRLHQIQSMKYLGFSLDDIKTRLISLETSGEVAAALEEQVAEIRRKIAALSDALAATEKLREETLKMDSVNWNKYADIVVNLQMKNDFYGFIKHFDDDMLDNIRSRFDIESGMAALDTFRGLASEIKKLQENLIPPESEQGQAVAKAWWDFVMDFTGGDMSQLPILIKLAESEDFRREKGMESLAEIMPYISKALEIYLENLGINPFEGANK